MPSAPAQVEIESGGVLPLLIQSARYKPGYTLRFSAAQHADESHRHPLLSQSSVMKEPLVRAGK
jgi:hypothetical protein